MHDIKIYQTFCVKLNIFQISLTLILEIYKVFVKAPIPDYKVSFMGHDHAN